MSEKDKKSTLEQMAELLDKVPESKRENVAAMLLGTVQGVLIGTQLESAKKPA